MNFAVSTEKAESLIIVTERKQRPMIMLTVLISFISIVRIVNDSSPQEFINNSSYELIK